jgi:hypothetical protein
MSIIQKQGFLIQGVVFLVLTYLLVVYVLPKLEHFTNPSTKVDQPCPPGYKKCGSGDCVLASDKSGPCPGSSFT